MNANPSTPLREALIEHVPILIGRLDGEGTIVELEGSQEACAADFSGVRPGARLADLFPDFARDIERGLSGGRSRFVAREPGEAVEDYHFELTVLKDRQRDTGGYFLIHDITELHHLQLAILECADREQIRIGEELHDTLAQELTAISFLLQPLKAERPAGLKDLEERILASIQLTRDIAFKLSSQIDGEQLPSALERLAEHIRTAFFVECTAETSLAVPIHHRSTAFHLFRIAQEAALNAVRHGAPSRVSIVLRTDGENVLEISDDGEGLDPEKFDTISGMGISMMRFRASAMSGALRITPRSEGGTLVRCRFANRAADTERPSGESCETCEP